MYNVKEELLASLSFTSRHNFVVEGESGRSRQNRIRYFSLEVESENQEKVGCILEILHTRMESRSRIQGKTVKITQ